MDIKLKIPLKELLQTACTGTYTNQHMQELYRLFYTIARQLVRRKIFTGKVPFDRLGLSEADITHDCIVELFTLGKDNELTELNKYFKYQQISIGDEEEELLFVHIRRLVFTIVNDNIFRLYNEADPALSRILRNIKIAVSNQSQFKLVTHFDEQFLELTNCDLLHFCETVDNDFLYHEIYEIMTKESEIPAILQRLGNALIMQDVYRRHVRMTSLALAIKNGYEQLNTHVMIEATAVDVKFFEDDAVRIIKFTCSEIIEEMKPRYVDRKKVEEETFDLYMKAVEKSLLSEFIDRADGQISYFDYMKECFPHMSKEEYLKRHRVILEYLGKISKKRVRERLKVIL